MSTRKNKDDFDIVTQIGEGSFGKVHSGQDKSSHENVAIKIIECKTRSEWSEAYHSEIGLLRRINHKHIANYKTDFTEYTQVETCAFPWYLYIVYELSELGLYAYIYENCEKHVVGVDMVCLLFPQLLCGLAYLKEKNIVHRDIKPPNILIDLSSKVLKICDFGHACVVNGEKGEKEHHVGTKGYRSPELQTENCPYSFGVDVWAAGCVLGEMLTGVRVFRKSHDAEDELTQISDCLDWLYVTSPPLSESTDGCTPSIENIIPLVLSRCTILEGKSLEERFKDAVPSDALDLLIELLTFDPANRISAAQALNHPFLTAVTESVDADRISLA